MSAAIKIFYVGEHRFQHVLDTANERIELRDKDNQTLLVFRDRTQVFNPKGKLGEFVADFQGGIPHWLFCASRTHIDEINGENLDPVDFGPDLFTAKVAVSRHYLNRLNRAQA